MTFTTVPPRSLAAAYERACAWIADNDETVCLSRREIAGFVSTLLVADTFGKTPHAVACRVLNRRRRTLASEQQ